jgi:hypothetical protein
LAALLILFVLLVASCSEDNERTYAFDEAVRCFDFAGFDVVRGGETTPPTPDGRDFTVWDGNRIVYSLVSLKSVGLAKERATEPGLPDPPPGSGLPSSKRERRGNVIVITLHGQGVPPAQPRDQRVLDRCLPKG